MVTTHSVYRLEGDRLLGTVVARYPTGAADSLLVLRSEGTRATRRRSRLRGLLMIGDAL
jgi:hypothetical protein